MLIGTTSIPSDGATDWITANWPIPVGVAASRRTAANPSLTFPVTTIGVIFPFGGHSAVGVAEAVIVGGVMSILIPLTTQVAVLPAASVAVQVTVVVPLGNAVPEGGSQTTFTGPEPLSLVVGVGNVTTAVQRPGSVFGVRLAGSPNRYDPLCTIAAAASVQASVTL